MALKIFLFKSHYLFLLLFNKELVFLRYPWLDFITVNELPIDSEEVF